ncbi:MAG: DUF5105 domain-containing protein [Clostridia bacterium]|nr:DUF5105 domain-containing protein [Clostridia bacterium]
MKKAISILLVLCLVFTFISCGKAKSPSDAVVSYLKDLQHGKGGYSVDSIDMSGVSDALENALKKAFTEFQYEVKNESIRDDKATVEILFTNYDVGTPLKDALQEYISEAMALAFSGADQKDYDDLMDKKMTEKLKDLSFSFKETVTFTLTKSGSKWLLDDISDNNDLFNAITGGVSSALEAFS